MSRFVLSQLTRLKVFSSKFLPKKLSRYHYRAFFVFSLVFLFLFSTQIAHAGLVEWFVEAVAGMLLALAKIAMALTIFFLRYFITLASYNDYINVSVVKLGWVMVRDVANMFFVVSLLVIAFATILGVEKYEWKKGLVKLVIMAILINFSNLIAQIIIDAAHVFTITFLNAVSASAGGNLINMFSMDKITSIVQGKSIGENIESATASIFGASVIALMFAVGTTIAIGSYVIVMGLRIVVLWALIILSPLAYLFSALPGGQKYSSKWWQEFSRHVIVAPVMVFFLWLAFATLGTGQIMSEIQSKSTIPLQQSSDAISVSITDVSTWENMANYILALLFLIIGLRMTQETGATASGMVGAAENWAKKVGTIAAGYAAGRWMVGKGKDKGKSLVGSVLNNAPLVGGKSLKRKGMAIAGITKYPFKRFGIWRDVKVQDWESNRKNAKTGLSKFGWGAAAFVGASLMSTSKRKDAVADNWKDISEAMDKEHDAKISTGKTVSGDLKLTARVRADWAGKAKDDKGPQKTSQRTLDLLEKGDSSVSKSLETIAKAKAKGEEVGGLVEEENRERLSRERETLLGTNQSKKLSRKKALNDKFEEAIKNESDLQNEEARLKLHDRDTIYQQLDNRATEAEAKLKQAKKAYEQRMNLGTAEVEKVLMEDGKYKRRQEEIAKNEARTKALTDDVTSEKELLLLKQIKDILGSGRGNVMENSFKSKAALEYFREGFDKDQIRGLADARAHNYEENNEFLRANAVRKNAAAEIQKKESEMFANLTYPDRLLLEKTLVKKIEEANNVGNTDVVNRLRKQKSTLTTLNNMDDAETARDTREEALKALGIDKLNDENRLLVELQRRLGIKSSELSSFGSDSQSQVDGLIAVFEDLYRGQEEEKQIVLEQIEKAAKSVALKGDEYGIGLIESTPSEEDIDSGKITRSWNRVPNNRKTDYWASRARGVDSIVGYSNIRNIDGEYKIDGFSERGSESASIFFKGTDSRAMASDAMKTISGSINQAHVDIHNVRGYIDFIQKSALQMQDSGFKEAKNQWSTFFENVRREAASAGLSREFTEAINTSSRSRTTTPPPPDTFADGAGI